MPVIIKSNYSEGYKVKAKIMLFLALAHPSQTGVPSCLNLGEETIEAKGFETSKQFGSMAPPLRKATWESPV